MQTDGFLFCQCQRGWSGSACDAAKPGFRILRTGANSSGGDLEIAVSHHCLVNGKECNDSMKCSHYDGAYRCEQCPEGFVSFEGVCTSKNCYEQGSLLHSSNVPCNGRGRCVLKDVGKAHIATSDDYLCSCYSLYSGKFCAACNEAAAVDLSTKDELKCVPRSCIDESGQICSGKGECVPDVGSTGRDYNFRCACNKDYTHVGQSCVPTNCVAYHSGIPIICGGFGKCVMTNGLYRCECDADMVSVNGECAPAGCTDSKAMTVCGGVGICKRNGRSYSCDCGDVAAGSLCEKCILGASQVVENRCVPLACVSSDGSICKNGGPCVKYEGTYHCRCPDSFIERHGECVLRDCIDEYFGAICSGYGACSNSLTSQSACICEQGYTYIYPGRCVPSKLITNGAVCSDNGVLKVAIVGGVSSFICSCSHIYTGENCSECNTKGSNPTAEMIGSQCIAKSCITQSPTPANTGDMSGVCQNAKYTVFGDSTAPYITCVSDTSTRVIAYNNTYLADEECTHVSQINKTRVFYCGLHDGLSDGIESSGAPKCSDKSGGSGKVCTCQDNFHTVTFTSGPNKGKTTCIHKDCHDSSSGREQDNYCGGIGDCIKEASASNYHCDCGSEARWDTASKRCVADSCMLKETLAGPSIVPNTYCVTNDVATNRSESCLLRESGDWSCQCSGLLTTYVSTCVLSTAYADESAHRSIGFCGGPGAGALDATTNTCTCSKNFVKIGGFCYSVNCLPSDHIPGEYRLSHVCSGIGSCIYTETTNSYSCKCPDETESYGGYCTHTGCAVLTYVGGKLQYSECGALSPFVECRMKSAGGGHECACSGPFTLFNKRCIHQDCLHDNVYCGGDALAGCVYKPEQQRFGCACSEGFLAVSTGEQCVPRKCIYVHSTLAEPKVCGGFGTCFGQAGTPLSERRCSCTNNTTEVTLRDITGVLKSTCVQEDCINYVDQNPLICGGVGECVHGKCVCDIGYFAVNGTCASPRCIVPVASGLHTVQSVCGGPTVASCVVSELPNTALNGYICKCINTTDNKYKQIGRQCAPQECVFPRSANGHDVDTVCGGHEFGTCVMDLVGNKSYCSCDKDVAVQLFTGRCIPKECAGLIDFNKYEECGGNGSCTRSGDSYFCTCKSGYKTITFRGVVYPCVATECITQESDGAETVCHSGGVCSAEKKCVCKNGHYGEKCKDCSSGYTRDRSSRTCYVKDCFSSEPGFEDVVCNGAGRCVEEEGDKGYCICDSYWGPSGTVCYPLGCLTLGTVCNGNGRCTVVNGGVCTCNDNYQSTVDSICVHKDCISTTGGVDLVCSGHGRCLSDNGRVPVCRCYPGYTLKDSFACEADVARTAIQPYVPIVVGVLVLSVLAGLIGFLLWRFCCKNKKSKHPLDIPMKRRGRRERSAIALISYANFRGRNANEAMGLAEPKEGSDGSAAV